MKQTLNFPSSEVDRNCVFRTSVGGDQIYHKKILSDLSFNVTLSDRSLDAAKLLSYNTYDLIVMKDRLPGINALLLMKLISFGRQTSRNKESIICLLCQQKYLNFEFKNVFSSHGFNNFLDYPILTEDLMRFIKNKY